jgi:hypothetical protein
LNNLRQIFLKIFTLLNTKVTASVVVATLLFSACTPQRLIDFSSDSKEDPKGSKEFTEAYLSLDRAPLHTFPSTAIGVSIFVTIKVTNSGGLAASSLSSTGSLAAPFSYKGGSYPGLGGNCATDLEVDEYCYVVVEFTPGATGLFTDTLEISYNNGEENSIARLNLKGTGLPANAILSLSDSPTYGFGLKMTGTSTDKTLTLSNSGGVAATSIADGGSLADPFDYKGGNFPGKGGTCTSVLSGLASCTIVVTFAPTSGGAFSEALLINYDDGVSPESATVNFTGSSGQAILGISDGPTYDYGSQNPGSTTSQTFTVETRVIWEPRSSPTPVDSQVPLLSKAAAIRERAVIVPPHWTPAILVRSSSISRLQLREVLATPLSCLITTASHRRRPR